VGLIHLEQGGPKPWTGGPFRPEAGLLCTISILRRRLFDAARVGRICRTEKIKPPGPINGHIRQLSPQVSAGDVPILGAKQGDRMVVIDRNNPGRTGRGPRFRVPKPGPEAELVDAFRKRLSGLTQADDAAAVFIEPAIDCGFPDLVAVYWKSNAASGWNEERANLVQSDLRLFSYLRTHGAAKIEELHPLFGDRLDRAICRLHDAGLICFGDDNRFACASVSFSGRRILAFEAKVNDWRAGFRQAVLSTRFATESYLLLPRLPKRFDLTAAAGKHSVGVWTLDEGRVIPAPDFSGTNSWSYYALMFHQWALEAAPASMGQLRDDTRRDVASTLVSESCSLHSARDRRPKVRL
jgi:hypothetical protein